MPVPGTQAREGAPRINEFTLNLQVKRAAPPDEKPVAAAAPQAGSPAKPAAAPAPASPAPAAAKGGKA